MQFTEKEIKILKEALGYGVMYSNDEAETAEFAMLKIKIESELLKLLKIENNKTPEFCPLCGKKCSGSATSYTKDEKIVARTYFHYKANSKNCVKIFK